MLACVGRALLFLRLMAAVLLVQAKAIVRIFRGSFCTRGWSRDSQAASLAFLGLQTQYLFWRWGRSFRRRRHAMELA